MKRLFSWLFTPIQNVWDSLKVTEGGFSMRKEIAGTSLAAFLFGNYKIFHSPALSKLYTSTLMIDAGVFLLAVGLVTTEQLIKFKNGGNEKPDSGADSPAV